MRENRYIMNYKMNNSFKTCILWSQNAHSFFVASPPRVITHPTDTSAAAPFSGVFTCSAGGYGHLNISWYREDVPHQLIPDKCTVNQTSSPQIATSTLTIPHVTEDDAGKYHCVVWANKQATRSRHATLYTSSMFCRNDYVNSA